MKVLTIINFRTENIQKKNMSSAYLMYMEVEKFLMTIWTKKWIRLPREKLFIMILKYIGKLSQKVRITLRWAKLTDGFHGENNSKWVSLFNQLPFLSIETCEGILIRRRGTMFRWGNIRWILHEGVDRYKSLLTLKWSSISVLKNWMWGELW